MYVIAFADIIQIPGVSKIGDIMRQMCIQIGAYAA
jgi:hypothetical protein